MLEPWIVRLREMLSRKKASSANTMVAPKPVEKDLPLPALSTGHPAGSDGKIEVMRQRAERGESLFHPNDNRDILIRQSHCARVG
jgi:hypothetical protein